MKKKIRNKIYKMTINQQTAVFFHKKNTESMKNEVKAICLLSTYITSKLLM